MERKIRKKLLAILMLITILTTDFFVLGSNLITYAAEINSGTNNNNIEFSAYFKESSVITDSIQKSIKDENLKLYAEIKVKNNGYFNGVIEIQNSNFNVTNEIFPTNTHIERIEGNKIILKQIDAGDTVEIELGITPIISEKISSDMLSKQSTVKLTGTYMEETYKGLDITAEKIVTVNYQADETAIAELDGKIITNKVLSVGGVNKDIIQVLIKSRLTDNHYPINQTTLNVGIPQLSKDVEEIKVMSIGKLSTNGKTEISEDNYTIDGNKVQIVLKNEIDANNEINWVKDGYDEIVVTFIYPENSVETQIKSQIDSKIEVNNNTYTNNVMLGLNPVTEINNVIMGKTEITSDEIYKGPIYANMDVTYNTETKIIVTKEGIVEEIILQEGPDKFGTEENELSVNTQYVETQINLNKMLEILGTDGNIEIKNGEITTLINKDTSVNETGNVVIDHRKGDSTLTVTTSNPVKSGVLEMYHTKVITGNTYTREKLQEVKTLITSETILGTKTVDKEKQKVVPETTEIGTTELKETISNANLTMENDKQILTTTETNEVTLGITLVTNGEQYDLFKNPSISIKFPEAVENVQLKSTPTTQNMNEFTAVNVRDYNPTNKTIQIDIEGEQTAYPTSELSQPYLQLNLDITLSQSATDKTDKISMAFINENAIQYIGGTIDAGIVEKDIQISAQPGLQKIFNISLNENKSQTELLTQQITKENAGQMITFETKLINNTGTNMNNVKILGNLPTTGIGTNTLETILKQINAPNATIYYTTKNDATADITEDWSTDSTDAKMYLIDLGTLNQGSNYTATIDIQIPDMLQNGLESYAEYKVIYNTEYQTNIEEVSRRIELETYIVSDLEVKLKAQVGQDELNNGDTVKEGEVIKYIVTLINNSGNILEDITLSAGIPEGTVVVKKIDNFAYYLNNYYQEQTDLIGELPFQFSTLQVGETQLSYEVRVNSNITTGTEILNKVIATYNNITVESEEITNKLEEANIRITIKKAIDEGIRLTAGSEVKYDLIVENLSNEIINNINIEIISEDFTLNGQAITIEEIEANGKMTLKINGKINDNAEKMNISAIATNSNNTYRSNLIIEKLIQADATISLTSPQNNAALKKSDVVEYNIIAENTGSVSEYFKIYYSIPEDFNIQTIKINGEITAQASEETKISNLIYEGFNLDVGQKVTIDIVANVKDISVAKVIANNAKVEVLNVYKNVSQEITHTLLPETIIEEDTKNIISGLAWLDANINGQIDVEETVLEGINVKIYDVLTQSYLVDENSNLITQTTDAEGNYIFTKIPNGEYVLVFDYDTERYVPTTYMAEGVDTALNSKVILKNITVNSEIITVARTEEIQVQDNITYMNIGLKEKTEEPPVQDTKRIISGHAWLDANKNGQKDDGEPAIASIKVKVFDILAGDYLKDSNGRIVETTTNSNGEYILMNIEKGSYKIIFEYDTENYELTTYMAQGVDETKSSKVIKNKIIINGNEVEVSSTDLIELENDITDINIGLKEVIPPDDGDQDHGDQDDVDQDDGDQDDGDQDDGDQDNGDQGDGDQGDGDQGDGNQGDGDQGDGEQGDGNQGDGDQGDGDQGDGDQGDGDQGDGNQGNGNEGNGDKEEGKVISGLAWLDLNRDGQKDTDEKVLSGITVKIYNVATNDYLTNENGNIVQTVTDANGKYVFNNIEKGIYILIFEYDNEEYEPTVYLAEGVDTTKNSKVIQKKLNINGQEVIATVTDTINLQSNILNINIGLKERLKYDLELSKFISKIVVQNSKGTKSYDYKDKTFAKVEIHRKQLQGSLIVLEYTIKVKNSGEVTGYAKNIVDYLPKGLNFSSELNSNWYLSGNYLYTKSLENVEINPGEEKEVKLILTKTMTNENTGLINNRAEIYQDYNKYGEVDIDSTPNNQAKGEDDIGSVDVIIGPSTGGKTIAYTILLMINIILIGIAIKIMVQNDVIKISTKEERR